MPAADTIGSEVFLSRELSSIAFNRRVLAEASDLRQPLIERVKFAAVFASNIDEFFMLRVGELGARAGTDQREPCGSTPASFQK